MASWFKHIGTLATILAVLIIPAHDFIPHDHHDEVFTHEQQEETPEAHCHALNVLFLEKSGPSHFSPSVKNAHSAAVVPGVCAPVTEIRGIPLHIQIYCHLSFPEFLYTESPLRAPPPIV